MDKIANGELLDQNQFGPPSGMATNENDLALLAQIQEGLSIVHGPHSSGESRKEASAFLDRMKIDEEAPRYGFRLASDTTQEPIVRHYALSLLEYAIKYKWAEHSDEQESKLRQWVVYLAQTIAPKDPVYFRNKVTQLWVEMTKRSWGITWKDMDEHLDRIWNMPDIVHKEFVLLTLETLSDDIFNKEDAAIFMRGDVLPKGCAEIFAPATAVSETFPNRERISSLRFGEQGWLVRVGEFVNYIFDHNLYQTPETMKCVLRVFSLYKSVIPWIFPTAITNALCFHSITKALTIPHVGIQLASVESLYCLYNRPQFTEEEFLSLVYPMTTNEMVDLLRKLFEWSRIDPYNIDDDKYLFAKKLSEMIATFGMLIERKFSIIPEDCDLSNFFNLLLIIAQSPSFVISIPVLHLWTRFLQSDTIAKLPILNTLIPNLLDLSSTRLIRYDMMPENMKDPSMVFLYEDIDTVPERHAFLGNYRRYNIQIIEQIARQKPTEAIYHILSTADASLQHLHEEQAQFSVENYSKFSLPVLQIDAHFTVLEAALRGYIKWKSVNNSKSHQDEQTRMSTENYMESWCERLLSLKFEDPILRKRVFQISVAFSTSALEQRSNFMLKLLEQILTNRYLESPEHVKYSEAVKEMQMDTLHELQRLALKMPDQLLEVYDQLERTINKITAPQTIDSRCQLAYQGFLFTIIHRSTKLNPEVCFHKLLSFIEPIQRQWQNPILNQSLASFDGFCNVLGLDKVKNFLQDRMAHEIEDWSLYQLDAEGHSIQIELEERLKALPLRATKSFLLCSTDRLNLGSPELKISRKIWKTSIPLILPNLLKFLRYAHAFHNPCNWTGLPPEMSSVITRILSDRFWQAGISEGSKEEFYARVSGTKSTMEGLASSIRGSVRMIREASYSILYCMSRFDTDFYGYGELAEPLAHSFFVDAHCLSSHQLINLLQVIRLLIEDCPVELRSHFVTPLLSICYSQIDMKCTAQWEELTRRQNSTTAGESLIDEMKEESLLRQVTHASIVMIGAFLDPMRNNMYQLSKVDSESEATKSSNLSLRELCLSSLSIMEPVLLFLSHAIEMRDTRSCGIVLQIFRSIIPEFSKKKASSKGNYDAELSTSIREFISRNVLMACISSLNESYFVDLQRDLAHCIVTILIWYSEESATPRQVLLSIPKLQDGAVDRCLGYINHPTMHVRHQRAMVLELLSEIKGVSISEQGRISKVAVTARKERSKMQQEYMKDQNGGTKITASPILDFVSEMFIE